MGHKDRRAPGAPNLKGLPARRAVLALGTLAGAVTLVALHFHRGIEYWNYSEGVYAYTARLLDAELYAEVVVAQPPWQFLFGAGVLELHDSLTFLRLCVGIAQLGSGLLAAAAVWRLTGSRWATAAAPALALLLPWTAREHGALTPELLAPPLLLGAALLAARPRGAWLAGGLAAVAVFLKWPFALALAAIVMGSAAPRRAAIGAVVALVAQAVGFTVAFGFGLWDDSVLAQLGSGRRGLHDWAGVLAQAGWSLGALTLLAGLGWWRHRSDPLARVLAALAVALLATVLSTSKQGTSLNVLAPVEAALLPLALAAWPARRPAADASAHADAPPRLAAGSAAPPPPRADALRRLAAAGGRGALRAVVVAGLAFTLAQTASLLATSPTATPFLYPTSERGAWGRVADGEQVRAEVARAEACPPGVPYSGPPFVAFLAHRAMPAGQPDQFLPAHSSRLADVARAIEADQPRC